jgi:hypothetical protein
MSLSALRYAVFLSACFVFSLVFAACKNANPRQAPAGNDTVRIGHADSVLSVRPADSPVPKTPPANRSALVKALKELHRLIVSGDKQEIGRIFSFPVPDSMFSIFTGDTAYEREIKANDGTLTAAIFDHYFEKISRGLDFSEFNKVFAYLDVDRLLKKDSISYDAIVKTKPCYKQYRIELEDDSTVYISYGINTNSDYRGKEDVPDGACEYDTYWTFVFDGQKLRLVRQSAAG